MSDYFKTKARKEACQVRNMNWPNQRGVKYQKNIHIIKIIFILISLKK